MSQYAKDSGIHAYIILILVCINVLILKLAFLRDKHWYWILPVTILLLLVAAYRQKTAERKVVRLKKRLPEAGLK